MQSLKLVYLIILICGASALASNHAQAFGIDAENDLPRYAHVSRALDEIDEFKISIYRRQQQVNGAAVTASYLIQLGRYDTGGMALNLPEAIVKGFKVYFDGDERPSVWGLRGSEKFASIKINDEYFDRAREIRIEFYGKDLGAYRFEPAERKITQVTPAQAISRFTLRSLIKYGEAAANEFKSRGQLINLNSETQPIVDLHTHLTGALRLEDFLLIAEKHQIPYPVEILELEGITFDQAAVFKRGGRRFVPFTRDALQIGDGVSILERRRNFNRLAHALELDPLATSPFERLLTVYDNRTHLAQFVSAFPDILEALAKDYQKQGIKYAELSFYRIIKPDFYAQLEEILPRLEEQYGVKLRFLVGLWRHSSESFLSRVISKGRDAMRKCPYIVGFDIMGEETNSTRFFAKALVKLQKLKREFNNLVVRVHAGENPNHPENILEAIRLGATRIGHGLYGVTDEVLVAARENNVIIEFNMNSNLAIENINSTHQLPLERYLRALVRVTLSTDGHGVYNSSPQSEESVARSLGLSDSELWVIRQSDQKYINQMVEDFNQRRFSATSAHCGTDVSALAR